MPFVKGNTIGATTRFKTGQSGNPAGRPPDKLRKRIEAELEKVASSEPGEARTKLELLAENIVSGIGILTGFFVPPISNRMTNRSESRAKGPTRAGNSFHQRGCRQSGSLKSSALL